MNSALLLRAVAVLPFASTTPENPTDWDSISTTLASRWSASLPPIPSAHLNISAWQRSDSGEFQRIEAKLTQAKFCEQLPASPPPVWPAGSITAGPHWDCDAAASACTGGTTSSTCRGASSYNNRNDMTLVASKPGTHWAKATAQPAWLQFRFPKPTASASAEFRFELDERYAPTAGGGNPCSQAASNSAHECVLCTTKLTGDPWDHAVPPGVRILWTYPGAAGHAIDPVPIDVFAEFQAGKLFLFAESPTTVNLAGKSEVIVTIFAFNQYPSYTNELSDDASYDSADPTKCSINWNRNATGDSGLIGQYHIALLSASLITRSAWNPPSTPPQLRPRLYGDDATWSATAVQPFFDASCTATMPISPGVGGASGVPDFKTAFELASRGYASCHTPATSNFADAPASINEHPSVVQSYADPTFRSFPGHTSRSAATQTFHLIRRMKICHRDAADVSTCQFTTAETSTLIQSVIASEIAGFDANARARNDISWGWEQDTDGCCGYDLFSTAAFKHFSVFIDVLSTEIFAADASFYAALAAKMKVYALDFVAAFHAGHWSLWNANNWTPVLSEGVVHWAVVFWHEEPDLARKVVHIVNDVALLHLEMWLDDGTYKEGVCQYSIMSLNSQLAIAVLYARAFGEVWGSINTDRLSKGAQWQLDSYDTAGYAIDFGDSHACRGTSTPTLFAAYSAEIVATVSANVAATVDPCLVRRWAALAYYVTVHDPWQFWPTLVAHDWATAVAQCTINGANPGANPLGAARLDVYEAYGAFTIPLLVECSTASAAKFGCTNALGPPKLKDAEVYAHLALQARPNAWPHSEVDFGTFKWTAWGQHLIGEFGYGTIGKAVDRFDARRLAEMDNSPVGHNTIIIREAYYGNSDEINFSQLSYVAGTIKKLMLEQVDLLCARLDGSEIYGASRTNGWFQRMIRWTCAIGTGSFIIIDSFATQAGRLPQSIYGAAYGGPSFAEEARGAGAQDEVLVDNYFHTPSWLQGQVIDGWTAEAMAFERSKAPSRCSHTDVELVGGFNASRAVLRSRCGLESNTVGDAVGHLNAWSKLGGRFIYDGLVSSPDRWGVKKLHQHRFRYEGMSTVGPAGDIRVFLLTTHVEPADHTPSWIANCSEDKSCISVCVGTKLYRFNVSLFNSNFDAIDTEQVCDGAKMPTKSPTVSPTASPSSSPSAAPSSLPSAAPSSSPSVAPFAAPTAVPSQPLLESRSESRDSDESAVGDGLLIGCVAAASIVLLLAIIVIVTLLIVVIVAIKMKANKEKQTLDYVSPGAAVEMTVQVKNPLPRKEHSEAEAVVCGISKFSKAGEQSGI